MASGLVLAEYRACTGWPKNWHTLFCTC